MVLQSKGYTKRESGIDNRQMSKEEFDRLWKTLETRSQEGDKDVFVDYDETDEETNVQAYDVASLYPASGTYSPTRRRIQKCCKRERNGSKPSRARSERIG